MSDNSSPRAYNPLIQHLEDAADGAHTHGAAIGLVHNNEAKIRIDLEAIVGKPAGPGGVPPAVPGLKALWNIAQGEKSAKTAALRIVCSNARVFARTCIRTLMPILGEQWNAQWNAAGFTGGSLAVPGNPLALLQQLRAFYAANPAREIPDLQGVACTAIACEAAVQAISDAQSASNQSNTDSGNAYANFQAGLKDGRDRLTGLRNELDQLIDDDDDRWYAFGFDKPSDPDTPEIPANLTVVPGAAGSKTLFADWDDARRADSYRLRAVLKTNGNEVLNEIMSDSQFSLALPSLASGNLVVISVTARNATGESPAGNAVEIAVP
jgi:hypothetical protein